MNMFIQDLKKLPKLFLGLVFVALGLLFSRNSGLGMLPWGVFHTGISNITPLTFGQTVQVVGIIILALSIIFVKIEPGMGTILNLIFVGFMFDILSGLNVVNNFDQLNNSLRLFSNTNHLIEQIIYLFVGIFFSSIGAAVYISCKLGAGPRDGLFVGITQITGVSVKYTKPIIEVTVTIIGILLKGSFGVGTIINALLSGYIIHLFFKLLKFDPKEKKHRSLRQYFTKKLKMEE